MATFDLASAKPVSFDLASATAVDQPKPVNPATDFGGSTLKIGPFDTHIPLSQSINNYLAGVGEGMTNYGRGAGQLLGLESRQDVANARKQDAPLNATGAGKAGNITGAAAPALATMAIPGANTVLGASLIGGGLGLLQPSTSTKETLLNTGIGTATGGIGQYLGGKLAGAVASRLASRQSAADTEALLNSNRDAILSQSRQEGYVIPPTAANPSMAATAAESIAGKAATRQAAEATNARVSNRLVSQDLGLSATQPLTRQSIRGVIRNAGSVYGTVENAGNITADQPYIDAITNLTQTGTDLEKAAPGIGAQANAKVSQLADSLLQPNFDAKDAVGLFRFLNERAKSNFKAGFAGDSQALELGRAQKDAAGAVGDLIQRHLAANGNADLATAWQNARTTIAKGYTALGALKGNNIDAIRLASQFRKDAPLTGGFAKVAQFADQFGEASRVPKSGAGVSKLAAAIGGGGGLTSLMLGHPELAAAEFGLAAAPYAVRKGILSGVGQRLLATPSYAPNALGTGALNVAGVLGRKGALPAAGGLIPALQQ